MIIRPNANKDSPLYNYYRPLFADRKRCLINRENLQAAAAAKRTKTFNVYRLPFLPKQRRNY